MGDIPEDPWLSEYNNLLKESDRLYRRAARQLGVPECTLWILYSLLVEPPPVTQKRLCQVLMQPKQTINSALKNLSAEGHITLAPGDDRRTREIILTACGQTLAQSTAEKIVAAETFALRQLGEKDREGFLRGYRKFNQLMQEYMSAWELPGGSNNSN